MVDEPLVVRVHGLTRDEWAARSLSLSPGANRLIAVIWGFTVEEWEDLRISLLGGAHGTM